MWTQKFSEFLPYMYPHWFAVNFKWSKAKSGNKFENMVVILGQLYNSIPEEYPWDLDFEVRVHALGKVYFVINNYISGLVIHQIYNNFAMNASEPEYLCFTKVTSAW